MLLSCPKAYRFRHRRNLRLCAGGIQPRSYSSEHYTGRYGEHAISIEEALTAEGDSSKYPNL